MEFLANIQVNSPKEEITLVLKVTPNHDLYIPLKMSFIEVEKA